MSMPPGPPFLPPGGPPVDPIQFPVAAAGEAMQQQRRREMEWMATQASAPTRGPAWASPGTTEEILARQDAKEKAAQAARRSGAPPEAPRSIADLAAHLIETRRAGTVAIVADVEIPSRIPGVAPKSGAAEIYRAWPVGSFEYYYKDGRMTADWAVTRDGKMVSYTKRSPSVVLDARMRWRDPAAHSPEIAAHAWPELVLARLQADADAPVEASARGPAATEPLVGKPLSRRQQFRLAEINGQMSKKASRYQNLVHLYGTPDAPDRHGPPDRHARKAFAEQAQLEREYEALQKEELALNPNSARVVGLRDSLRR